MTQSTESTARGGEPAPMADAIAAYFRRNGRVQADAPCTTAGCKGLTPVAVRLQDDGTTPMTPDPVPCPACLAIVHDERRRMMDQMEREARIERAVANLALPKRYADVRLEGFELHGKPEDRKAQAEAFAFCRGADGRKGYVDLWPNVPDLVVFYGPPGDGKTAMAFAIAKRLVETRGTSARWTTLAEMIRDLREPWRDKGGREANERRRIAAYTSVDLLHIDEASRHAVYGGSFTQHLMDVLGKRYNDCKPTILTTNEEPGGIAELLGGPLTDRLREAGALIFFGNASYRAKLGAMPEGGR